MLTKVPKIYPYSLSWVFMSFIGMKEAYLQNCFFTICVRKHFRHAQYLTHANTDHPQHTHTLQAASEGAHQREAALLEERSALKAALGAAIAQKDAAEAEAHQAQQELVALKHQCTNLRHQVSATSGAQCTSAPQFQAAGNHY